MKKTVALIMPVLNEEDSASATLDSVFASTRLPNEIVVADGGSTDRTIEIVNRYAEQGVKLTIVDNPDVYAGAGRNIAVAASAADVLLLLDFGNIIHPEWIEKIVRPFEEERHIDWVSGGYSPLVESDFEHVVAAIHYHANCMIDKLTIAELFKRMPKTHEPGALSLAISRDMWDRTGGMPGWLRASEDKLFGRKMMALNPKYRFVPDARIYHHMRSNTRQLFRQLFVYCRGSARTRYFRPSVFKTLGIYTGGLAALFYTPAPLPTLAVLAAGATAYVWHSGVRRIVQVDDGLQKPVHALLATPVVVARDLGTLAGFATGLIDWLFVPKYRRNFARYTQNTPREAWPIFPR